MNRATFLVLATVLDLAGAYAAAATAAGPPPPQGARPWENRPADVSSPEPLWPDDRVRFIVEAGGTILSVRANLGTGFCVGAGLEFPTRWGFAFVPRWNGSFAHDDREAGDLQWNRVTLGCRSGSRLGPLALENEVGAGLGYQGAPVMFAQEAGDPRIERRTRLAPVVQVSEALRSDPATGPRWVLEALVAVGLTSRSAKSLDVMLGIEF